MEALRDEILTDLTTELNITDSAEMSILTSKIKNAIREVKSARRYPKNYTNEAIVTDLYNYYSNIRELAMYDYCQIGAEGETAHSENGTSRTWKDREKCFNGVYPFTQIF